MLFSAIIVGIAALAFGAKAIASQVSTAASATATTTSSAAATTHSVSVGASGFILEPAQVVNASVGDIIEFRFYPTGHWIVRSEFKQACIPYEDTGANKVGFSSGPIDVATTSNNGPTFQVLINDTQPIFFYCAAPGSCTDQHMVGVINPNSTFTYDIQLAYAQNATYQMTPGEAFPSETASSSTASSTSGTSSSSSSSDDSHRLGTGAIAGIAIGGAAVAILAAAILYNCGRRGGMDRAFHHGRMYNSGVPPMHEARYANGGGAGPGPRSPGQETFTTAYSMAPSMMDPNHSNLPQHPAGAHQPLAAGYPPSSRSPPLSEYSSQQSLYKLHGQPQHTSPLIGGMDGGNNAMQNGFFITPQVPPQHQRHPSSAPSYAVELPTSNNPGNSPLPGYSQGEHHKTYSWVQEGEGTYRPSKPQ